MQKVFIAWRFTLFLFQQVQVQSNFKLQFVFHEIVPESLNFYNPFGC